MSTRIFASWKLNSNSYNKKKSVYIFLWQYQSIFSPLRWQGPPFFFTCLPTKTLAKNVVLFLIDFLSRSNLQYYVTEIISGGSFKICAYCPTDYIWKLYHWYINQLRYQPLLICKAWYLLFTRLNKHKCRFMLSLTHIIGATRHLNKGMLEFQVFFLFYWSVDLSQPPFLHYACMLLSWRKSHSRKIK